ncbi:hypothetical protein P0F65_17095 [Sphingomonas sp. I4]
MAQQVTQLRSTLEAQAGKVTGWLSSHGVMPGTSDINGLLKQSVGSIGKLTSWVGTAVGAVTTMVMILVIGLFLAMDPEGYARGLQWVVPRSARAEFAVTQGRVMYTLRRLLAGRLLGMAVEGC